MVVPVTPARLKPAIALADGLIFVARALARAAAEAAPPRRGPKRGATLRPGPRTPMWNALVLATRPHLAKWGEKSKLARILGVPPQRIHDYFGRQTAAPDAERVLLLLTWLAQREAGLSPG
ncbi:MAG: hypothetical protein NTV51_13585 [Verrucomicrobia bacterium]|nr:hypothetical protein [Verrucomicrobiota bacterium]